MKNGTTTRRTENLLKTKSITSLRSYLELGGGVGAAADAVHAVVSLGSPGERDVPLVLVPAASQRHVAHQQQPGAVRLAGLGVFQAGTEDREPCPLLSKMSFCVYRCCSGPHNSIAQE